MNEYHVQYSDDVLKSLQKLDRQVAKMIVAWVRKHLEGCSDPRVYGKALTANHAGKWRYRIGDYRLIAHIDDVCIVIMLIAIGHRSKVYDQH